jgi:ribosomal protein L11 methylase PrmA
VVIDPFCGTGSTGVAALRHGCYFIGLDTDPEAVVNNITINNMQCSQKAIHAVAHPLVHPSTTVQNLYYTLFVQVIAKEFLAEQDPIDNEENNTMADALHKDSDVRTRGGGWNGCVA